MAPSREGRDTTDDGALLDALVQTSFTVIGAVSSVAAHYDLSLTQIRVLAILRDHTPTMSELANHLGLDRSTVTGLIDRATERGLVRRIGNAEDRRSSRVTLTKAGVKQVTMGATDISTVVAPLVAHLTPRERRHLTALLEALVSSR